MKIGINSWSLPSGLNLEETFSLAKEAGFETVELNMSETEKTDSIVSDLGLISSELLTMSITQDELAKIKEASERYQLPISSIATDLHWKYALSSSAPTVREQGKEVAKRMIDTCKYLGGDTVLIVPGVIGEEDDYQAAYFRAQESLKELSVYAQEAGIIIGVENVWNKFLLTPLEMCRFIDEIGHPFVKVYFDVGNVLQFGFPTQWIKLLGNRIAKIHVKDFKTQVGNIQGFTQLLSGSVNWPEVVKALREIKYEGPLTAELTPYKFQPEQLAKDTASAIAQIIKM